MIISPTDKPFACNEKNCRMTFANEDHLNSHKKKHNMSFDLDLAAKNNDEVLADQTPTPTSFFRNCEEVGLFQDLQNVNPFEETFKKAIECSENSTLKLGTLSDVTNEDTLHTPHIFPSVEDPLHSNILDLNNRELSIVNMIEIPHITERVESISEGPSHKVEEKTPNLKSILKGALLKKEKQNKHVEKTTNITISNDNKKLNKSNSVKTADRSDIERIREINRAAQMKCRVKKKRQMDKMMNEFVNLKKENQELKKENAYLKQSNIFLWKAVEDLGGSKDAMIDKINLSMNRRNMVPSTPHLKQLPLLAPAGSVTIPKVSSSAPKIYNLVPVQILDTSTLNGPPPLVTSGIKRQKAAPRILKKT